MKKYLGLMFLFVMTLLTFPLLALAQDGTNDLGFLTQVFDLIGKFGGMSFQLKISSIILLIIGSMKVSFMKPIWDKLGAYKVLAAPALSLIAGLILLPEITFQGLVAYLFAGAGAIILHEVLDAIKSLPGIGAGFKGIIEFISNILKKPKPPVTPA